MKKTKMKILKKLYIKYKKLYIKYLEKKWKWSNNDVEETGTGFGHIYTYKLKNQYNIVVESESKYLEFSYDNITTAIFVLKTWLKALTNYPYYFSNLLRDKGKENLKQKSNIIFDKNDFFPLDENDF